MSEDTFLQALFPRLGVFPAEIVIPPGDDCAALRLAPGRLLLVAVDQVVGGRHYHLTGPAAATPEQVGRKLLARNLSDIAAMGGRPTYCLLATALAPGLDEAWLARLCDGIVRLGQEYGVLMIGGDLARTPTDTVASLTILGEVDEDRVCRRTGAQPGDAVFVTGTFGRSLDTGHHLSFTPRCREGQWLSARGCVHAMMDVSDGLLLDLARICRASHVTACLDGAAVPRRTPDTTPGEALRDGEDYELVLAVPSPAAPALARDWPFADVPLTRIGEFRPTAPGRDPDVVAPDGRSWLSQGPAGYDHLRAP